MCLWNLAISAKLRHVAPELQMYMSRHEPSSRRRIAYERASHCKPASVIPAYAADGHRLAGYAECHGDGGCQACLRWPLAQPEDPP